VLHLIVLVMINALAANQPPDAPAVGQVPPDFSLEYATKDSIAEAPLTLSRLLDGKTPVLLAFYPADWSGGCTKEVCSFRDDFSSFRDLNVEILGISGDYVYSHFEWAKHHNLPFKLLADHLHEVGKLYGSYNEATGYNRRTVYLIAADGRISYRDLEYSTRDTVSLSRLKTAVSGLGGGN
jgi:peroxiredoxin Q/BCP